MSSWVTKRNKRGFKSNTLQEKCGKKNIEQQDQGIFMIIKKVFLRGFSILKIACSRRWFQKKLLLALVSNIGQTEHRRFKITNKNYRHKSFLQERKETQNGRKSSPKRVRKFSNVIKEFIEIVKFLKLSSLNWNVKNN